MIISFVINNIIIVIIIVDNITINTNITNTRLTSLELLISPINALITNTTNYYTYTLITNITIHMH